MQLHRSASKTCGAHFRHSLVHLCESRFHLGGLPLVPVIIGSAVESPCAGGAARPRAGTARAVALAEMWAPNASTLRPPAGTAATGSDAKHVDEVQRLRMHQRSQYGRMTDHTPARAKKPWRILTRDRWHCIVSARTARCGGELRCDQLGSHCAWPRRSSHSRWPDPREIVRLEITGLRASGAHARRSELNTGTTLSVERAAPLLQSVAEDDCRAAHIQLYMNDTGRHLLRSPFVHRPASSFQHATASN